MADIGVQRKERSFWPWIVGLLVLAALAWLLMEMLADDDEPEPVDQTAVVAPVDVDTLSGGRMAAAPASDAAVDEYLEECSSASRAGEEMSVSHEYVAECVRLLAGALNSVVERVTVGRMAIDPAVEEFRETAAALEETPETSSEHSNMLRTAAIAATDVMARAQEARQTAAPELAEEVAQARTAADAIRDGTPLMEQTRETGDFFQQAGDALRMLAQR